MNRAASGFLSFCLVLRLLSGHIFAEDTPTDLLAGISVPADFAVEVAAAPPLVEHPLMAGFDDRGRLYIAESAGQNLEADELMKTTPNFVRRLEDTDGDGRFDRSTIFADKMTMPMGALWHAGALYVASPPYIWRLEDTNDDGVADRRDPIVGKFGFIGNAADIHGCFLGPNGRLYWCDGRHGHRFVDRDGKIKSQGKAARIFSCRLDGSDVQAHCGGGMDNPVEIDFTPEGEMLGTVNLLLQKRGDCLVQWMHGGAYPRYDQEAYVAEFKRTGDLLPPVIDLGHVAVSGMTRYRGPQWGEEFRNNIFITQFNTHKVVRLKLTRDGSTYRPATEEFWASASPDCHPTDVLQDADDSLLVIDTGGWFRHGCPTSQIAKPHILGAIYRVRRRDAPTTGDPRGKSIDWLHADLPSLVGLLNDPRPAVAGRAIQRLSVKGEAAVAVVAGALNPSASVTMRRHALWVLTRIETDSAKAAIRTALTDPDDSVRHVAVTSISTTRDPYAVDRLMEMVVKDEPPIRREAATALGRIGNPNAVPALLESARNEVDRLLDHANIYALIELNNAEPTQRGLDDSHPSVRRSALIALDQMDGGKLARDTVIRLLDTDDARLRQAAIEIIARRQGWAGQIVDHLRDWIVGSSGDVDHLAVGRGALVAFMGDPAVRQLVGELLTDEKLPAPTLEILLTAIARAEFDGIPNGWKSGLDKLLASGNQQVQELAIAAVSRFPAAFVTSLNDVAHNTAISPSLRGQAAAALAHAGVELDDANFALLIAGLDPDHPPLSRLNAAEALGGSKLKPAQLKALVNTLPQLGPLELPAVLHAFDKQFDPTLGDELVAALVRSSSLSLSATQLEQLFAAYPTEIRQRAQGLIDDRQPDRTAMQAQLAELESQIAAGHTEHGREVFFGPKAACAACHTAGGQGGQIGPDLTKIGSIRSRRDLLEAIVFPSLSLARGFESFSVATNEGLTYTGVIRRETPDAIWLRTADRAEIKLPRTNIEQMAPSGQSVMPEGLIKLLTPEERQDLLAFLMSLR